MQKRYEDRLKQYTKVILIICCIFAVISSFLIIIILFNLPEMIKESQKAKYLYENGIEVDAYIKSYYYNRGTPSRHGLTTQHPKGHFYIIYEYVDDNNRSYKDEYRDTFGCWTEDERDEREQYIKQLIAEGKTIKMLISDNGSCCLSIYKESLVGFKSWFPTISVFFVSSFVLILCIFGIVKQSKKITILRKYYRAL